MTRKICVVVTARPSYSRIRSVLQAITEHPELQLQVVVGASALLDRYGNTVDYIQDDGFKIDARVYMVVEGENLAVMAKTTGMGLIDLATCFDNLKPDAVVTIADRYETMATAIAASYMNIPLVHIQGGEVTGSIDEKVRHAVTKLADLHFVATEKAAERVIRMGENESAVHVTGCPSIDVAAEVLADVQTKFSPYEKYGGVGGFPDISNGYVVVTQHPVTTEYQEASRQITETLEAVSRLELPALWFWPNVDAGSDGTSDRVRAFREHRQPSNMHFFKNMGSNDFLRLLIDSRCVVGNSSVALRECSFLGVPAVNIGTRQLGRERGPNVVDVSYDRTEIESVIRRQLANGRPPKDQLYGDGKAGKRIASLLAERPLTFEKRLAY